MKKIVSSNFQTSDEITKVAEKLKDEYIRKNKKKDEGHRGSKRDPKRS